MFPLRSVINNRNIGGEEEGAGVRSGPGAVRTILLFHTISVSARPSKQPRMVGSTLGVCSFGLIFVSARTNIRHHHHHQAICTCRSAIFSVRYFMRMVVPCVMVLVEVFPPQGRMCNGYNAHNSTGR
jgi:hypothetical protein